MQPVLLKSETTSSYPQAINIGPPMLRLNMAGETKVPPCLGDYYCSIQRASRTEAE